MGFLVDYLLNFGWVVIALCAFWLGMAITLRILKRAMPGARFDELLNSGSVPAAIVVAATMLSVAIVVGLAIKV